MAILHGYLISILLSIQAIQRIPQPLEQKAPVPAVQGKNYNDKHL